MLCEGKLDDALKKIDQTSEGLRLHCVKTALDMCLKAGITMVQTNDFDGFWSIYNDLHQRGELPIRVALTPTCDEFVRGEPVPPAGTETPDGMLRVNRLKIFADGSLGACTAALRCKYKCADTTGILIKEPEVLERDIRAAHSKGYRLEVSKLSYIEALDKHSSPLLTLVFSRYTRLAIGRWRRLWMHARESASPLKTASSSRILRSDQ